MRQEYIVGFVFGIIVSFIMTISLVDKISVTKKEVIKHNCAEYNCTTGKFQWKK
jgi:hypothetical protein